MLEPKSRAQLTSRRHCRFCFCFRLMYDIPSQFYGIWRRLVLPTVGEIIQRENRSKRMAYLSPETLPKNLGERCELFWKF
jgi:hypothetical protein